MENDVKGAPDLAENAHDDTVNAASNAADADCESGRKAAKPPEGAERDALRTGTDAGGGAPAAAGYPRGEGDAPARDGVSSPAAGCDRAASDGRGEAAFAAGFAARSGRLVDEAEALYAQWTSDAAALAKEYPGFDLAAAAREPKFARLLRGGADLRSAYEATHMDAVRSAIRAAAAAEAEARVLDGVRLRGLRPDENGARSGSAVLTGGMAGLSREERARIAERAMRGLL